MTRVEVQQALSEIPNARFVYSSVEKIVLTEEREDAASKGLSGRIYVITSLYIDGFGKSLGNATIDFDAQDRVVDYCVDGLGFQKRQWRWCQDRETE